MRNSAESIRPAAVAGSFYPGDPDELRRAVLALLGTRSTPRERRPAPKAVIVPHAGYIYSGAIAAEAYSYLADAADTTTRVVIFGPCHRVAVRGLAAPAVAHFETPLGRLTIDRDAIASVASLPQVVIDDGPHALEHSLEVQLPFLQRVTPRAKIVPFAVGDARPSDVAEVIERLWEGPETRFVISSDLSHYLPYVAAQNRDLATAQLIEQFAGDRLGPEDACGCIPVGGMLRVAKARGLAVARVDLRNSGDTAGPRDRVVGYGAWTLS